MTERILIKNLAAATDGPVTVSGWVDTVRDQKKVQFIVLHDESGALQLVHPRALELGESRSDSATPAPSEPASEVRSNDPIADTISALGHGSFITVTGTLKHDERVKLGGIEVLIATIEVVSEALESPIAEDTGVDKRMDWRFLDLRVPKNNLVLRVQTTLEHAWRSYWVEHDFIEIHTPKLMASASESKAELFEVEYFDGKAYLAQSPQFFKQMAQPAGFGKIFEIGRPSAPTRASPVGTRRSSPASTARSAGSTRTKTS